MSRLVLLAALLATAVLGCWVGVALAAQPALETTAMNWGQQSYLNSENDATIVLNPVMHGSIASLKAANPNVKVLMYDNVTFTNKNDCSSTRGTAVSYCAALKNDPSWFLRNTGGQTIAACDFPGYFWMDVGNAAYRSSVATQAGQLAKSLGFDGVMLDDVNTDPGHCENNGGLVGDTPSYTDQAWGAATVGLMSVVGPALKKAGLVVEANIGADAWTSYQEADLLDIAPYTTRISEEHWMRWNCSTCTVFTGSEWLDDLQELEAVQRLGVGYAANTYSDGTAINNATILYTRASLMLGWSSASNDVYDYHVLCTCSNNYSSYESITAGTPTDSRYQVGVAWRRDFTNGTVLVNPSPSSSQSVTLGACYVTPAGSQVHQVTLSPGAGTILRKC
jgi:hypothetical protein